jgi:hypothetical protein
MLQVFYLYATYVCNDFQVFSEDFFQVFQKHVSSVLSVFFCILQVLHGVSKIDRASVVDLHLVGVD